MTCFSLKRPITVFMLTLGLCLLGAIPWQRLPVQLLPQFILPEVYVGAGMPGASPEKIERELVFAIEAELATLEGVHDIERNVFADYATTEIAFNHGCRRGKGRSGTENANASYRPIFNAEMKDLVAAGAKYLQLEDLGAWMPLFTGNKDDYK